MSVTVVLYEYTSETPLLSVSEGRPPVPGEIVRIPGENGFRTVFGPTEHWFFNRYEGQRRPPVFDQGIRVPLGRLIDDSEGNGS